MFQNLRKSKKIIINRNEHVLHSLLLVVVLILQKLQVITGPL